MLKATCAVVLAMGLAACQATGENGPPANAPAPMEETADQGPDDIVSFAQAACGGCHAVERAWQSPNPRSPTFPDIANRAGLTAGTLSTWLRDAHNYPEEMDFDLTPERVEQLARYIATLRDENYKPPVY